MGFTFAGHQHNIRPTDPRNWMRRRLLDSPVAATPDRRSFDWLGISLLFNETHGMFARCPGASRPRAGSAIQDYLRGASPR